MTQGPPGGGNPGPPQRPWQPGQPGQPGQFGQPGPPPTGPARQNPPQGPPSQAPPTQRWPNNPPPPGPGPQGWPPAPTAPGARPGPPQQAPQGWPNNPQQGWPNNPQQGWPGSPQQLPAAQPWAPGPGYPPPPAKPGGRGRLIAWVAGAAAVLLLAVIAIVAVVTVGSGSSPTGPSAKGSKKSPPPNPAIAQTRAAALDLARQPAARYTGTLTTTSGADIPVDLSVTNAGTTLGRLGTDTEKLQILVMSGKTFFLGDAAFWKNAGATASKAAKYASRWVRIEAGYIGIDPEQRLAPRILSAELVKAADAGKLTAAPVLKNGVNARPVTIPQGTVYISTEAPYRVVHIDTETTQDPGGGLTPASYADDSSFDLDIAYVPAPAATSLFARLKTDVSRLAGAIDSQVDFDLDGSVGLNPCTSSGCTATATLSNKLRGSGTYVRTDAPIIVEVVIAFTLDARPIRSCTDVVTMAANGKAKTSCRVRYSLPADGSRHTIRAAVSGFAKALSAADVATMQADLKAQTVAWRVREAGEAGLPDASIGKGRYQFRPPATYNPATGPLIATDGGYVDVLDNVWTEATPSGLAKKQGYSKEWRVKLSDRGLAAWQDVAKDGNVNVTPHGDISH